MAVYLSKKAATTVGPTVQSKRLFHDFSGVFDGIFHGLMSNARITIKHVCFSALTFAGFLGRSLNIRPSGLMFKQLPRDPANVNA